MPACKVTLDYRTVMEARRTSFPEELERGGAASEIYRLTSAELYRPGEDTVKFFAVLLEIHSSLAGSISAKRLPVAPWPEPNFR